MVKILKMQKKPSLDSDLDEFFTLLDYLVYNEPHEDQLKNYLAKMHKSIFIIIKTHHPSSSIFVV